MTLIHLAMLTIASAAAGFAQERLVWLDSYEAARKEAKVTGKPIFLEFRCAP